MAHYDIFLHHLVMKYPAYGHALWVPSPVDSSPAVEVGDVGFIREGRFYRLFNVLLPADDPSHQNFGVPEYHQRLTLRITTHINSGTLSPNNFCSSGVATSESSSKVLATSPDSPAEVAFWCSGRGKQGAVLSLPVQARSKDTIAHGQFGEWIIKNIDTWFAWARQLGLGVGRMEDMILVTGTHRTRSWTNVAFPRGPEDGQISFGANVAPRGDSVAINWTFSHERNRGAVLNCGPNGEDLLEDQCIFIRGFRVCRRFVILPRGLKAAAGPNPDPKGDDYKPDVELMSIPAVPEYRDPLHAILEYITDEAPHCEMALVHDDDLALLDLDVLDEGTSPETLQLDMVLSHLRRLKPKVHDVKFGLDAGPSSSGSSTSANAETLKVATISVIFPDLEGYLPQPGERITFTPATTANTASQRPPTQDRREWELSPFLAGQQPSTRMRANEVLEVTVSIRDGGPTSGESLENANVIAFSDHTVSGNQANAAKAGGVMKRLWGYVTKHFPGEQERRGDRRLDEARTLIVENQPVIDSCDLEVIEERISFARELKLGLDSKWGLTKFLHTREYRKSAKSVYYLVKCASDRGRDMAYFGAQRHDASLEPEMSHWDRVTDVALSLRRIYLSCKDAFPTPQMKAEWEVAVWREACAKTATNPESFLPFEIFAEGNIKLFTETKKRVLHIVEAQYGFDTSHSPDSISRNAALSQALLSNMAFIYREPNPGGTQHHPYRHPSLQKVINLTWFRNKDDDGVVFHEYFSPLSVPAIAFILAVIECCIDEWTDGTHKETEWDETRFKTVYQTHISLINDFWQHYIAQGTDLFENIRSGLLKEARKHAGIPPEPVMESETFSQEVPEAAHREGLPPGLQLLEINMV